MRVFASDTVKNLMSRLNIPEDEPIAHGLISRSLESAQKKIEGFHFDSRKHVLEYDDVLNQQRLKIYERRKKILMDEGTDLEEVLNDILLKATPEELQAIEAKKQEFKANSDEQAFLRTARGVMLQTIDLFWIDHLEFMDYLRSSVNLRAYGQRDPLVEYKREGLRLFKDMEFAVDREIIRILTSIQGQIGLGQNMETVELKPGAEQYITGQTQVEGISLGEGKVIPVVSGEEKIGRNDPCPCGSGKKYKKCHGV